MGPNVFYNIFPILLCISNSIESIVIHDYSSRSNPDFSTSYLLLSSEILRIFVIFTIYSVRNILYKLTLKETASSVAESLANKSTIHYFIISLIYTVSNNLGYRAVSLLEPVEYNVLSTLKIPMTIFISNIFLPKMTHEYKLGKFLSAFIVLLGNCLIFLPNVASGISSVSGTVLAVLYTIFSAIGAVYSEHTMTYYQEHILTQSAKFSFFSLLVNWVMTVLFDNYSSDKYSNKFSNVSYYTAISVMLICLNGFATSLVIKYNGGVAKSLSTAGSTALTMILKNYAAKTTLFYTGAFLSFTGVFLYSFPQMIYSIFSNTNRDMSGFSRIPDEELLLPPSLLFEEENYEEEQAYYNANILQNGLFPKRYLSRI